MIAIIVWTLAVFVYALERWLRLEISLRNYRRNSPEEASTDRTASRAFVARSVAVYTLIIALPSVIPVIVVVQFGEMGLRIGMFGALVGLGWQLLRFSGTLSQTLAYCRTGRILDSDDDLVSSRNL